jgi:hypothetical protein
MKTQRIPAWVLVAVVGLIWGQAGSARAAELNILFFGNSFSIGAGGSNTVPAKFSSIAQAKGYAPMVVADLESGAPLSVHIGQVNNFPQNNVNHPSIAGKTWDYVVIQGYSTEPTQMGNPSLFRQNALGLYEAVADHSSGRGAGVKAILYETWARHPNISGFYPTPFANASAMQSELRTQYDLARDLINLVDGPGTARVAPVGDAFEARDFNLSLYNGDLYHASNTGYLLASMIIFRTIYLGETVSDIPWSTASSFAGVSQTTWNSLAATADSMVIVPEPTATALMILPILGLARRRRVKLPGHN